MQTILKIREQLNTTQTKAELAPEHWVLSLKPAKFFVIFLRHFLSIPVHICPRDKIKKEIFKIPFLYKINYLQE